MAIKLFEGELEAKGLKFAIVAARFNAFVVDRLLDGAIQALLRHGAKESDILVARVPGAFDLPVVAQRMAENGVDAVIALGAVIRGATPHFEYVSAECASGLTRASLDTGVPIAFGVLTTDNEEQARERAGEGTTIKATGDSHVDTLTGNKGADAALCAIEMVNVLRAIGK